MKHAPSPHAADSDLRSAAEKLITVLAGLSASNEAPLQKLEDGIRECQTYLHRRAANSERDRACYRVGGALEPYKGHLLDDVALSGWDHLGAFGLLLLVPIALAHPQESLSGLLRLLFASEAGAAIREWGTWSRFHWLRDLYVEETETFLLSKEGSDPKQRWRRKEVSARQGHLIREISRAKAIDRPTFTTRGDAFDWIKSSGGNPRFWTPPPMPALPALPVLA